MTTDPRSRHDALSKFSRNFIETAANPLIIQALDVEIDLGQHCLRQAGNAVALRPKSFQILAYLAQNHSRLVPKEELFEKFWKETAVSDGTLSGCIQDIRRALADDSKVPRFIRTVHGVGYQFLPHPEVVRTATTPQVERPSGFARSYRIWAAAGALALTAVWLAWGVGTRTPVPGIRETAWWKLDENSGAKVADTRAAFPGTFGPQPVWTKGVHGNALLFDGRAWAASGWDDAKRLPLGESPKSIAAWVRADEAVPEAAALVLYQEQLQVSGNAPALFLLPDGRAGFGMDGFVPNDGMNVAGPKPVVDGKWHHLAGTHDGGVGVFYLDGTRMAAAPIKARQPTGRARVTWRIGNGDGRFRGAVDDVRVYARALRTAEVAALYRCTTSQESGTYFLPVFDAPDKPSPGLALEMEGATSLRHTGVDYAGIQFARARNDCAAESLRGADIGQNVFLSAELRVPKTGDAETQAGPYFRSRAAGPGDGIIGGTSAGFWVRLHSTGVVTVRRLNPIANIAYTAPVKDFDASSFHRLEVAVKDAALEVALDGKLLTFDQAGKHRQTVELDSSWQNATPPGRNAGTGGIAFSSEPARGKAGEQQARAIAVGPYRPLR